jgi:hypothetical protein
VSAPFTVVTFVDEDGDEFPFRIDGAPDDSLDVTEAAARLALFVKQGHLTPRGEVTLKSVERV